MQKLNSGLHRLKIRAKNFLIARKQQSYSRRNQIRNSQEAFHKRRYLLLDLSTEGSLGDDAMISGSIDYLRAKKVAKISVVSHYGRKNWDGLSKATIDKVDAFYDIGRNWDSIDFSQKFKSIALRHTDFCAPGADLMDGHYSKAGPLCKIKLCKIADELGLRTSLMAFSFNENPRIESIEAIASLSDRVTVSGRDPLARQRLEHLTRRNTRLTADLAFLLQPEVATSEVESLLQWTKAKRAAGEFLIGINGNRLIAAELGCSTKGQLCEYFASCIRKLADIDSRYNFLMLPHDYRASTDFPSDHELASLVYQKLQPYLGDRIKAPGPERLTPKDIKLLATHIDLVVTSRMHLAIACLGVGTPPIGIPYQGKFEGLYSYFGLESLLLEPAKAACISTLVDTIHSSASRHKELRAQILHHLPRVTQLSESNFD